jgi:hypothetical protein
MQPAEEIMKNDIADKSKVTAAQQQLLKRRYNLTPKLDPSAKMSRGKPLPAGPTARLQGMTWQTLAKMAPEEIRKRAIFLMHHVEEEEGEMFPKIREVFDEDELEQLGQELESAKGTQHREAV